MAKLVFDTSNLIQVYIVNNQCPQGSILFVYSDEPFSSYVECGSLWVNNESVERSYFDVLNEQLPVFETLDYSPIEQLMETPSITPLIEVSRFSYDVDEDNIIAADIKFRRILPWDVYDLSEIQYKGKTYKGIKHQ